MKNRTGAVMREGLGKRFPLGGTVIMLCGGVLINFILEALSRFGIGAAIGFICQNPVAFVLGCLIVAFTLAIALLFRRKLFSITLVSIIWLTLGIVNYLVLRHRTGYPLTFADLALSLGAAGLLTVYYKWWQIALIGLLAVLLTVGLILLFIKSPKYRKEKLHGLFRLSIAALLLAVCLTFAIKGGYVRMSLKSSLYHAYVDCGFSYSFVWSAFDRGISRPSDYSQTAVNEINVPNTPQPEQSAKPERGFTEDFIEFVRNGLFSSTPEGYTEESVDSIKDLLGYQEQNGTADAPNIIFIQLESFFDPLTLNDYQIEGDPIPNFRALSQNYTSGKLSVPTVSGGTANTEYEVLTGCNLDFFGAREFPFQTVLQEGTWESLALDLKTLGLYSTFIHNYTGSFYNRNIVYQNLCFDRFVSEEYMTVTETNPKGWAKDTMLTGVIESALGSTQSRDFLYVVTVQSHGAYPDDSEEPARFRVIESPSDEDSRSMEYYLNQINEVDVFIGELTSALSAFDEPVAVVMFGDHLPGLNFNVDELPEGDLYATPYLIWTNYPLEKQDKDLEAYQLGAYTLMRCARPVGTMVRFHAEQMDSAGYMEQMEILEYDIVYGEHYVYGGKMPERETEMAYGITPITLESCYARWGNTYVTGKGFTPSSTVYVNDSKRKTIPVNSEILVVADLEIEPGDTVKVCQIADDGDALSETDSLSIK
ncbi:MAG: sulfatase-like hydrolase/transferase [Clostridiales bacterium]|nr:sulfatase-like hydrolase/transferase [Clostridiales bacterium]